MTGDLHNIDNLFKTGLEGKEEAPGEKVWNAIEQGLDKNSAISIQKKYNRMRAASAILLLLLLGVSIYAIRHKFIEDAHKQIGQEQINPISGKDQQSINNSGANSTETTKPSTLESGKDQLVTDNAGTNSIEPGKSSTLSATDPTSDNSVKKDQSIKNTDASLNSGRGETPTSTLNNTAGKTKNNANATRSPGLNTPNAGNDATGGQHPSSSGTVSKNNSKRGNNKTTVPSSAVNNNDLVTSPTFEIAANREFAMIESSTARTLPGTTKQLSGENALSEIVKTNQANTLSIPVKNPKNNRPELARFSIAPMASLNLMSNQIVQNPGNPGTLGNHKEDIQKTEKEKLSYTIGLLFDLKIAKRMTIQTGIGYMQKTTYIDPKNISAVKAPDGKIKYQFDCSAGRYYLNPKYGTWPMIGDSAATIASANQLHYITVPLALTYYFGNKKWSFYALAGGEANILHGQDLTTGLYGAAYYGKKSTPTPIGLNNVYINGVLGGGVNYSLNRWLGFTFSPTYKFALNPINKDMPFKAYPRSLSLSGGLRVSF